MAKKKSDITAARPFGIFQEVFDKALHPGGQHGQEAKCPQCNCGGDSIVHCDDGLYFCQECSCEFQHNPANPGADSNATYSDPVDALVDLQAVLTRVSVIACHVHDLVITQTPKSTRSLSLLNEIEMLALDGMRRISDTGLQI